AALRVIGRAPRALPAAIGANALARETGVRETRKHIGNRRRGETAVATRAPDLRIHRRDRAVRGGANPDLGVGRGPITGDHQFQIAVAHQFDGAPGFLREDGADGAPFIDAELRAKSAAHVLAIDVNLVLLDVDGLA